MMYPYLPEMMRNPETFEMLLSNPMYKDQLRDIMRQMKAGGGADGAPGMGMPDVNSPEVQEQFAAMGMTPQDVISKPMGDPELAMAFQNPKIQQAVMDCSSNPNNIMKYQNDPEIMQVFMKLATMFPAPRSGAGWEGCRRNSEQSERGRRRRRRQTSTCSYAAPRRAARSEREGPLFA